ncbi:paraslipin [Dulcicalothrix desertica PCC 7102]|uniref:Paraslipin n=1 Tax=Dulcicalothrix desertica PCC 7102 TaxID=232991 RepID=A0A3S1ADB5_9CYAN|nr:SPFH domain-containing protein [Dulcicalothrix desertica]RUS98625.1 paraslipin [Dulcicalothrix desertica PCC 7102]TWH43130.1 regulator of protease activity HflC (stomatin/prohibitin superfamily) [Dulcicalothrix desertica PCC 7102]
MEAFAAIVLVLIGYALGSAKLINEGNEALVERLGRYHRKLRPGMNFIVPLIDSIVMEDTTREQVLDIKPQNVITADNVYILVDGVIFWRINDMEKSFYRIDDIQVALANLIQVELRANLAERTFEQAIASRTEVNQALLKTVNETAADWGVQVIRVDIQSITPPESVQKSMADQNAAVIRKRAAITAAEGEQEAAIKRAQATRTSVQILSEALRTNPESKEILKYLVAQEQVEASHRLGTSNNAKVVFLNPGVNSEAYAQMVGDIGTDELVQNNNPPENGSATA